MITEIKVNKYKKIKELSFNFSEGVNLISGTNGTCKTSLLHIVSNSVKSPLHKSSNYKNPNCFKLIKDINLVLNPKIESLVRDAKNYVDPANGIKGNLFEVTYSDGKSLKFRRHNSKNNGRYSIKPLYSRSEEEQHLPSCPVIYLSLSRLFPTGEVMDEYIENVSANLPPQYIKILSNMYGKLLNMDISNVRVSNVSDFKSGPEFISAIDGIDSNTISSGEDNLFIILKAIVSLAYYHDSLIDIDQNYVSILLIDEFDATLHPSLQEQIYDIIIEYSHKYKIQVFMTTHSLSLLEYAIERKNNLIYLLNNFTDVDQIVNPSIVDIKMHLKNQTRDNIYNKKRIPLFLEDDEARFFLKELFSFFEDCNKSFAMIERFFHLVPCKIGADNLNTIFSDPYLLETSLKSICILDGDKENNLNKCTITLPGDESPESMLFKYIEKIFEDNDVSFWRNMEIIRQGYTKQKYISDIRFDILEIKEKIQEIKSKNGTTKGLERQLNKNVFNQHIDFFRVVVRHWINNKNNHNEVGFFYSNLKKMFLKVSLPNGIEKNEWSFDMTNIN